MRIVISLLLWANVALGATFTVSMTNVRFTPADLTVNVGDTVIWRCDVGFHDAVSGANGAPSGVFDSNGQYRRLMRPGETYAFTFTRPGTFPYYCTPHWPLGMVGTIRVNAPNTPPIVSILNPPDGATLSAPANVIFEATASDPDGSVRQVELFMNGGSLGVFTSPPYRAGVNGLGPGNYNFSAVATDDAGATGSAAATITVSGQQPTITTPPQSQTVTPGSDVLFTVEATGTGALTYQWLFGASVIPGATGTSLQLTSVSSANEGIYTVRVSNNFGTSSASATLTVTNAPPTDPPTITTQPRSQTVNAGTNVIFTVDALSLSAVAWQWFFNNVAIPGATAERLELTSITVANSGEYYAVASNEFGSTTSVVATLTVNILCDFTLSTNSVSFTARGGSTNVTVTAPAGCAWTVVNTNAWITARASGNIVIVSAVANTNLTARTGLLLIAGQFFVVTQTGQFPAKNDFNRDGFTDVLWHHKDGRVLVWLMDGVTRINSVMLRNGRPGPFGASLAGTHDFDLDQNADILWRRSDGRLQIWFMRGTEFLRSEFVAPAPRLAQAWQVVGLADFNSDTQTDILLRHRDGYLLVWYMKGKRFVRQELLRNGEPVSPVWRVAAAADVNGDGASDILWQKPLNPLVVWFMAGNTPTAGRALSRLPRTDAKLAGVNDLNQDGQRDFIWRHPDGRLSVWWMNQTNRIGSFPINSGQPMTPGWRFAAPIH